MMLRPLFFARRPRPALALAVLTALTACESLELPPTPPPVSPIPAYAGPTKPEPEASAASASSPSSLASLQKSDSLTDRILDAWLADDPSFARYLGIHAFDGKVADCSRAAIEARIARTEQQRAELAAVDKAALGADAALDLALLIREADLRLFHEKDLGEWRRRPQFYGDLFDVNIYLERDYAPLEERAQKLLAHERAALLQVPHIRENLESPLSAPVLATAVSTFKGFAEFLRGDVVKQLKGVGTADFQADFATTNEKLAAEADALATYLKAVELPRGDDSHVLGVERYQKLLFLQEGLTLPLAELKRMGEQNLTLNRKDYDTIAKRAKFTKATSDAVFGDAARIVSAARKFLIDKKIVTIPTADQVVPRETPPFMRWNAAFLSGPGPFETRATTAFFYITRPDPSWTKKEQDDYLMPLGVLLATTIHETYPGHFLQDQWIKRAPTRAQKMLSANSFIEGWAHYGEQMMIEEGFGGEDPQSHLGQLADALLRNCRLVVSLGVHTEKMTLEQAEARFVDDCYQDRATARQQAARATFDPGYFVYTLGKMQILALRDEAKKKLGPRFSLQRFHDALLAHGSPPVALIRERVLRDLGEAAK